MKYLLITLFFCAASFSNDIKITCLEESNMTYVLEFSKTPYSMMIGSIDLHNYNLEKIKSFGSIYLQSEISEDPETELSTEFYLAYTLVFTMDGMVENPIMLLKFVEGEDEGVATIPDHDLEMICYKE